MEIDRFSLRGRRIERSRWTSDEEEWEKRERKRKEEEELRDKIRQRERKRKRTKIFLIVFRKIVQSTYL